MQLARTPEFVLPSQLDVVLPAQREVLLPTDRIVAPRAVRARVYGAVLLSDITVIALSVAAVNVVKFGAASGAPGINLVDALLPLYIPLSINQQSYCWVLLKDWKLSARRAISSLVAATAALLFLCFFLKIDAQISRAVSGLGIALIGVLLVISRYVVHLTLRHFYPAGLYNEVLIHDGACPASVEPGVVRLDTNALNIHPEITDPKMLNRIGELLRNADRVVVACDAEQYGAWAMMLKASGIRGELLMPNIGRFGSIGTSSYGSEATLVVSEAPFSLGNRLMKRLLDLSVALCGLVLLAPLLAAAAIAVKLDSPGPILFVQPRVGRGNRLFTIFKFRTMRAETCDEAGDQSTARSDLRVTRVGRFLRMTSIDELPQVFNVIRGEMSIVGPRPHAMGSLAGEKLFWEVDERYWQRHAAKPGITGLAQVKGFRGATHRESDLIGRLRADLDYLHGWSIWRDLSVIAVTIRVLFHKNAY